MIFFIGKYPIGEICEYKPGKDERTAINRMTSQEKKALEVSYDDMYKEIRIGAEVHRTVINKNLSCLEIIYYKH